LGVLNRSDRKRGTLGGLVPVRFVRDVALTGGAQVIQGAFTMIAGIMVARLLGASARGTLSVLVALGAVTVLLASFGIHQSSVYFMGRMKDRRDVVVSNTLLFAVLGGITAGIGLSIAGLVFHAQLLHGIGLGLFFIYVWAVPFRYFNEFARLLALSSGRVAVYNLPAFMEGGGLVLGTALLTAVFGAVLVPLVALRVGLEVITAAVLVVFVRRTFRFRLTPSREILSRQIRYGIRNYAGSLLWLFLLQSDLVLCNYFLGAARTGVYSVAVSTGLPISMLGSVAGVVIFQRAVAEEDRDRRIANTNRVVRLLLPLVVGSALLLGLLAHSLIPLIYGHAFSAGSEALVLLLPGLVAFSLEVVLMNFVASEGSPPVIFLAPLAGVALNLGGNLVMIPQLGINGASITSSAGYGLVLVLVLWYYLRSTGASVRDLVRLRRADFAALTGGT